MPSIQAIVASLILSVASAKIIPRDLSAVDDMVLADCGIGTLPNPSHSTSRQVFYYANGFQPGRKPDQAAQVVWDGSYPWRNTGINVQLPNGQVFNVVINPDMKDDSTDYAGWVQQNNDKYLCRSNHGQDASKLASGTQCTTSYIYHRQAAAPAPAPRDIVKAQFTMSSLETDVRVQGTYADEANWAPATAFAHINEAIEGNQCKPKSYSIGNDCTISFECTFGNPANVQPFTSILTGAVTKALDQTKTIKTGHYQGDNCGPADEGCIPDVYEFEYLVYTYPQTGKILVTVEPEGHPELATVQSMLSWSTQCKAEGVCGAFCGTYIKLIVDYIGGFFKLPPIAAIACSAC